MIVMIHPKRLLTLSCNFDVVAKQETIKLLKSGKLENDNLTCSYSERQNNYFLEELKRLKI